MIYEIHFVDSFTKAVKQYKKRYPNVAEDVKRTVRELQKDPTKGVVPSGWKGARKIRVENSDVNRGKSGSYRLLYYVVDQPAKKIYLLALLAKSDREDFSTKEVLGILRSSGLI